MNLTLTTVIRLTTPYKGGSKYEFWKDTMQGGLLEISFPVVGAGRSNNGSYAQTIDVHHLRRGEHKKFTIGAMEKYLRQVEFEDLSDKIK